MNWLIETLLHRGNDLSTYFLPNAYFFKRSILEYHQIPLWNPIQFAGFPYIADPQNYLFYLPNYLLVFLPIEISFIILLFGHLTLAGIGTFLLAKKIFNLSSIFAVFSSLAFIFTPKMFSHLEAGHYTMIVAFSWLPLCILVGMRLVQKPSIKKALALAFISWIMYVNYINIIYFALIFFAAYSAFFLVFKRKKISLRPYAICYTLFAASFAGLIAPVLLPQIEIAPLTTRSLITYTDVAQPIWSLTLFVQNLLFPFKLDHAEMSTERVLFPGFIVLGLAAVGFFKTKRPDRSFFLGWIVFSLLFALGDRIPFFVLFYKFFPLMSWMRVTTRLWIITNLIIAVFAGLGLKQLVQTIKLQHHFSKVFLITVLYLSFADIMLVNLKIFSRPIQPETLPESFYTIIKNDPEPNFRVYCTTGCFSLKRLGELGIYTTQGNNPAQLKESIKFIASATGYKFNQYIPIIPPYPTFESRPQPNAELFAQINTKYIVSPYPLTNPNLGLIHQEKGFLLFQNRVSRHKEETFPSAPQSLRIGLSIFALTWAGLLYAYRHPQFLYWPRRARR